MTPFERFDAWHRLHLWLLQQPTFEAPVFHPLLQLAEYEMTKSVDHAAGRDSKSIVVPIRAYPQAKALRCE
jgi:hypothetical protein